MCVGNFSHPDDDIPILSPLTFLEPPAWVLTYCLDVSPAVGPAGHRWFFKFHSVGHPCGFPIDVFIAELGKMAF